MPVQPAGTATAKATISAWQGYSPSPLVRAPEQLAAKCGVAELWLKDETNRFGLGSFKVLGGGLAVVNELAKGATATATASAGNHGIGVAWASANPSFGVRQLRHHFDVFLTFSARHHRAIAVRCTLPSAHPHRMLIGACNPMACPICVS